MPMPALSEEDESDFDVDRSPTSMRAQAGEIRSSESGTSEDVLPPLPRVKDDDLPTPPRSKGMSDIDSNVAEETLQELEDELKDLEDLEKKKGPSAATHQKMEEVMAQIGMLLDKIEVPASALELNRMREERDDAHRNRDEAAMHRRLKDGELIDKLRMERDAAHDALRLSELLQADGGFRDQPSSSYRPALLAPEPALGLALDGDTMPAEPQEEAPKEETEDGTVEATESKKSELEWPVHQDFSRKFFIFY